jgi:hypothetical protein
VISGCNGGWFGFEEGLVTGDGDLGGGDVVSNVGDMTVVISVGGSLVVDSSITAIMWV